ncbi:hypothetical protein C8Q79DRAFT_1011193 [Trametes meyenii]|nr:hypothetical protein C8Q79DRAFT_1011193 [Trametes meyenii]
MAYLVGCHWVGPDLECDVRVIEGVFPEEEATTLPAREHVKMEACYGEDLWRCENARLDHRHEEAPRANVAGGGAKGSVSDGLGNLVETADALPSLSRPPGSTGSTDTLSELREMDMFGLAYNAADDMLPVVRVWLDIASEFAERGVPNPMGFIQESEAIASIVRDSKARMGAGVQERMAADRALAKFGWAGQHIVSETGRFSKEERESEEGKLHISTPAKAPVAHF